MRCLIALFVMPALVLAAESDAELSLNAERVAARARSIAPEIAAAKYGQAIAAAESRAAYAFAYPHLKASADYTRASLDYQEVPVFGRVAFNREREYRWGVILDQHIYSYNRFKFANASDRALRAVANQQLTLSVRDITYEAKVAFQRCRVSRAAVIVAQDRVEQRRGERDDVQALEAAGRASKTDANLAELALQQSHDELLAVQADHERALIALSALLAYERDTLPALAPEPMPRPELDTLLATARSKAETAGEPALLAQQQTYEAATSELQRTDANPSIGIRATYGADGQRYDNLDDQWTAGIRLTWNLYDGGGTLAQSERLAQRSRQLQYQRAAAIRDRVRAVNQAASDASQLQARITVAENIITLATSTYEDARAQYRAGRLTLTQVGDTSVRLAEARYHLLNLLFQEAVLGHDLERLAE